MGKGERIKKTENFDSSDEDEQSAPLDPFHIHASATSLRLEEVEEEDQAAHYANPSIASSVLSANISARTKKEIIVQRNREELIRNVNHFDKQLKQKDLLISHEEIRKQIDKHIFKGGDAIVMPQVRIQMINEVIDDFDRPQALRDAIQIAESERLLYQRMRDTDPELLRNAC